MLQKLDYLNSSTKYFLIFIFLLLILKRPNCVFILDLLKGHQILTREQEYGFSNLTIDTETNQISAISEVKESKIQSLKHYLKEKNITFASQPSKNNQLISANLVTKIVVKTFLQTTMVETKKSF